MTLALPLPHAPAWPSPRAWWRRWRRNRAVGASDVPEPAGLDPQLARGLLAEVEVPAPYPGMLPTMSTVWEQRRCSYCEGLHTRACPRIREIEYHPDGAVRRVSYWPSGRWDEASVLWLDEVQAAALEART